MTDTFIFDGQKSYNLLHYPPAWKSLTGGETGELQELQQKVPWLFRGIDIRSGGVADMPFIITRGEEIIDNSENYENVVGWLPDPTTTLWLIEAGLTIGGKAYLFNPMNRFGLIPEGEKLRYLLPTSITPKYNDEKGLDYFERAIGGERKRLDKDFVIYFWGRDPFVEIGPPNRSPAQAAVAAGGVLFSMDQFIKLFFERGAIKATVVSVPRGTQVEERNRVRDFFSKMISGLKNANKIEVFSTEDIKTTVIGEGLKELENVELTKEKREDIATAMGIPQSYMFSSAANYATASIEDLGFYTRTIKSEIEFIEKNLNMQLFDRYGLKFKFIPQAMSVFQEDEVNRSAAYVNLVRGNIPEVEAMQILGFDLPEGLDWDTLAMMIDSRREKEAELNRSRFGIDTNPAMPVNQGFRSMLETWERHSLKALKEGKSIKGIPGNAPFDHEGKIPETLALSIGGALRRAKTPEMIRAIFNNAKDEWENYP